MKTIFSPKFVSIAAVAAALFTTGSIARAGEVIRSNVYAAPRGHIEVPIAVRPIHEVAQFPVRPVVIARGPVCYPAPVRVYAAPRPVAPLVIREGCDGRSYGYWVRR